MATDRTDAQQTGIPDPHEPTCPWCPYTDALLKRVLMHMESAHPQRWRDLALSPLIAGGGRCERTRLMTWAPW
jgi:hypothetical protein